MEALAVLIAAWLGFMIGKADEAKHTAHEFDQHKYWFDRYIALAEKVAVGGKEEA